MKRINIFKGRIVVFSITMLLVISSFVSAADKVILYKNTNFKGDELRISTDVPDLNASPYYFGAKTSSIKFLVIEPIAVYSGVNYTGTCQTITTSIPSLKGSAIGNDNILSLKLNSRCQEVNNAVILYKDKNYGGQSLVVSNDTLDLKTLDFNDKTSSLKLKGINKVAVYEHKDYFGKCYTYTTDAPDVGAGIGNDKISSVRPGYSCDDYKVLRIQNNAGFNIRYYLNNNLKATLMLTDWWEWNYRKNTNVKVKIEWWAPSGDEHWQPLCEYDIIMDSNITIKTHGVIYKGTCEVEHKYN